MTTATVVSVSRDSEHHFTKPPRESITLLEGLGVEGDAHSGTTVKHRSRVAVDPTQPNLRQVHLIHSELFDEVAADGYTVRPGDMGENITTSGLDVLALPQGAILQLGDDAMIEVTGLRNPCRQINGLESGLMKKMVTTDDRGVVVRKAGIMSVVLRSGSVRPGDAITVILPDEPHLPLAPV